MVFGNDGYCDILILTYLKKNSPINNVTSIRERNGSCKYRTVRGFVRAWPSKSRYILSLIFIVNYRISVDDYKFCMKITV